MDVPPRVGAAGQREHPARSGGQQPGGAAVGRGQVVGATDVVERHDRRVRRHPVQQGDEGASSASAQRPEPVERDDGGVLDDGRHPVCGDERVVDLGPEQVCDLVGTQDGHRVAEHPVVTVFTA